MDNYKDILNKELGEEIKYISKVDKFIKNLLTTKFIEPKEKIDSSLPNSYFKILRKINSYYPSFFDVDGGCYIISIENRITIIDPGYRTLKLMRENHIDSRNIHNIIITHNHPDHNAGLPEILNLLFTQSKKEDKYYIYLNPGTKVEYSQFIGDMFDIIEIQPNQEYTIEDISTQTLNFKGILVKHDGIGKKQESIGLIFDYNFQNQNVHFGILGDTDGEEKYIEDYSKDFHDLKFIVLHIGSLKFKSEDDSKLKHLYSDGIIRIIESSKNIDFFILQEFGLEMEKPKQLADILYKVVNSNYLFLPYLILTLLNDPDYNNQLFKSHLLGSLFSSYIENTNNYSLYSKWVSFSEVLCLNMKSKILYNIWEIEDVNSSNCNEIKSCIDNIWKHYEEVFYWKITSFNKEYVKNIESKVFSLLFNDFKITPEFKDGLDYNLELLEPFIDKKFFLKIENIFRPNSLDEINNMDNQDDEFFFRIPQIDFIELGFSMKKLSFLKIFSFIHSISFLIENLDKSTKIKNFDPIQDYKDVVVKIFKEKINEIEDKFLIGDYGKRINFKIFWDTYTFCDEHGKSQNNSLIGKDIFLNMRPCVQCQADDEIRKEPYSDNENEESDSNYYKDYEVLIKKDQLFSLNELEDDEKILNSMTSPSFDEILEISLRTRKRIHYNFPDTQKNRIQDNAIKFLDFILSRNNRLEIEQIKKLNNNVKYIFIYLSPDNKRKFRKSVLESSNLIPNFFLKIDPGIDRIIQSKKELK